MENGIYYLNLTKTVDKVIAERNNASCPTK